MLYIYKKIIFYLNLNEIEKNDILYDLKYIILSYIHSDFKFIKFNNTDYEIFFENDKIKKNIIFKKIFKKEKIYIKINKNINEKGLYFLKSYFYSNYFENIDNFISYCSEMNFNEFLIFTNMLEYFGIELFPEFSEFFYKIINEYTEYTVKIYELKFKTLLYNYFNSI